MGLAIEVGILADLKTADEEGYEYFVSQFELLNTLLSENGLPRHTEPDDIPVFGCDMYGYSGLHYLRRIAAHLLVRGQVPDPCDDRPNADPIVEECYDEIGTMQDARSKEWKRFDHLLCHSDAEGFYVPIEFDEVLFDFDDLGLAGAQLGSSQKLLSECVALAQKIGMPTEVAPEDGLFHQIIEAQGQGDGWHRYGIESYVCIRLIKAAEYSIKHGAAIVFT